MSANTASRVHFYPGQFLRLQEFVDEQAFHLEMRRRHNIAHHSWGIVSGLEVAREEDSFIVQPGFAIDGFGRELALAYKRLLPSSAFAEKGKDQLDVYLLYSRQTADRAPRGYTGCREAADDAAYYRWREEPVIQLRDAESPPDLADSDPTRVIPDDPQQEWPVLLGRIQRSRVSPDDPYAYSIDLSARRYAGLVAERVIAPSGLTEVQIGVDAARQTRRFAIFARAAASDPFPLDPQFEIDQSGTVTIRAATDAIGDVAMKGGAIDFKPGIVEPIAPAWRMYRRNLEQTEELRIEIPGDPTEVNQIVIGSWRKPSDQDEQEGFLPCLTIAANETVKVDGDLIVEGQILYGSGEVVPPFSGDAQRATLGARIGGIVGANLRLNTARMVNPLIARTGDALIASPTPASVASRLAAEPHLVGEVAQVLKTQFPKIAEQLRDALK